MNNKHRRTLAAIFATPTRSDIAWADIIALFYALGADITEGNGSRVRVALRGARAVFHRPHPDPTKKWEVEAVRRFLISVGVNSNE